jgi:hypothetical protein
MTSGPLKDLVCPHCGQRLSLVDGRLELGERPAPGSARVSGPRVDDAAAGSPKSWSTRSNELGIAAFAGAFKKPRSEEPPPPPIRERPTRLELESPLVARAGEPDVQTLPGLSPTQTEPQLRPPAVEAPAPAPVGQRPTAAAHSGPTLLDALERDPSLTSGQREAMRLIYVRFAPHVVVAATEGQLDAGELLERDPNLNEGQRETLRTVFRRFKRS